MILLSPQITFSQTAIKPGMNAINHKVAPGETVLDISKKYGVDKLTAAQMGGLECGKCHY